MALIMMCLLQQSQWAELEANIVFSSFANSVFQSFANIVFSSFLIKRIKRFAADIKFLCSCFLFCWPTLSCATFLTKDRVALRLSNNIGGEQVEEHPKQTPMTFFRVSLDKY